MTAEDVAQYCVVVMLPQFLAEAQKLIDAHNADAEAHPAIQNLSAALDSRLSLLELMYNKSRGPGRRSDRTGTPPSCERCRRRTWAHWR